MNTRSQTQAPARSSTPGALLRFLFDAMSGMGAAKLGWEMVTDPKAKLSDIALGVPLCLAPPTIAATWALCLFGIAQHHQLF
ncbi:MULTISPECIES: hypothetical protein [Stenotrophomonas]|uniref:hypothetical protein n=1 Tax=Stenotrophomonas TaxID=40323 RepID=UPI0013DBA8F9|nr:MULTISPECIES: hypothetical protein [Stenotrophomonas]ELC7321861.1 hypothetical protein [Stenotrophomonas maltophilia]MBA0362892.1 hypothetical protein [Stenotrophomonas maltophilia]MBH1731955.1 hypothetical protein [Stenotrophomonas maltophilia]HEL3245714.1 hypothetical protein [Stenotrophomonas maltophilia]HEL4247543.1 hypothetical protein [Stenotrophomonas maltophilia]